MEKKTVLTRRQKFWLTFWLVIRDIRNAFIFTFNPEYFERTIRERKGKCPKNCSCCGWCEFVRPDGRCSVYKTRIQMCRDSPVDRFDKWLLERNMQAVGMGRRCKLWWE